MKVICNDSNGVMKNDNNENDRKRSNENEQYYVWRK